MCVVCVCVIFFLDFPFKAFGLVILPNHPTLSLSHRVQKDAWGWCTGRPREMVWGGRREEGSGWGTRVYLWRIHVDIWQNQYNIIKLKKKKHLV